MAWFVCVVSEKPFLEWEIERFIESSWHLIAMNNIFVIYGTLERGGSIARAEFNPAAMELKVIYDFTGYRLSEIPMLDFDGGRHEDELFIQRTNPEISLRVRPQME